MEMVKVFDENYTYLRNESRDTAHSKGLWHETIHCWLTDEEHVYVQKRSRTKKDFPGLFDITAAGHILADETVEDGLREIKEELGIHLDRSKLHACGAVRDVIELPGFYDNEFAHVFIYNDVFTFSDFILQKEEVEGIYVLNTSTFIQLCLGEARTADCRNLQTGEVTAVSLAQFVPHERSYFTEVVRFFG